MNIIIQDLPQHIKKEMDQLRTIVSPLMKKVSRYTIWTFPLIMVSLFNLFFLLFVNPVTRDAVPTIILYAVLGAIGFALLKETKVQSKEIQKVSEGYMIERIKKSNQTPEHRKNQYIAQIKGQPSARTINHFIQFLMEEERQKA